MSWQVKISKSLFHLGLVCIVTLQGVSSELALSGIKTKFLVNLTGRYNYVDNFGINNSISTTAIWNGPDVGPFQMYHSKYLSTQAI